jgi:hypothetical protein
LSRVPYATAAVANVIAIVALSAARDHEGAANSRPTPHQPGLHEDAPARVLEAIEDAADNR